MLSLVADARSVIRQDALGLQRYVHQLSIRDGVWRLAHTVRNGVELCTMIAEP